MMLELDRWNVDKCTAQSWECLGHREWVEYKTGIEDCSENMIFKELYFKALAGLDQSSY